MIFEYIIGLLTRAQLYRSRAPRSADKTAACCTHRCEAKGCLARARSERRAASDRLRGGAGVRTIMQGYLVGVSGQLAKARALNDNARGIDRFGYRVYAKGLYDIIHGAGAEPPVCVGLYAKWGSGKSFLINCIKQAFDPGIKEDPRTHDMRQWFERTPEDADAAEDKEIKDESYCAYTRAMARPRCEQLVRILTGVSLPAAPIYMPLWAEALARVATEMIKDMWNSMTSKELREFAPRELAAVEGWCAQPGCGRAVRQALIWGVVGAVVVVQLGVNVNVSRKIPGDAMPSRLFVFVLALVGFVLGAVASVAYTCRPTQPKKADPKSTSWRKSCPRWWRDRSWPRWWRGSRHSSARVFPHDEAEAESKGVKTEPETEPDAEYVFVDYNAWEYAGSDELWTGLIRNIYEQVEKRIECGPHKPCELRIVSITVGGHTYTGNLTRYVKNISTGTDLATVFNTIFNTATTGNVTFAFDVNTLRMIATHNANSAMTFGGSLFEHMLHFPVNETVASPTVSSQAIDVHYPISKPVLQAGSERNLKRE